MIDEVERVVALLDQKGEPEAAAIIRQAVDLLRRDNLRRALTAADVRAVSDRQALDEWRRHRRITFQADPSYAATVFVREQAPATVAGLVRAMHGELERVGLAWHTKGGA